MNERLSIPRLTDDESRVVNGLLDQLKAKQPRNLIRASFYDGKHAVRQVGSIIPPQYYRLGIVLGWSAKAVDILARRTNPERFVWSDGDLDALGMAEVVDRNDLMSEIKAGIVSAYIHGTSFLITTQGDESAGESRALLHVKDAFNCTGDWNPRARRLDDVLSVTSRDRDGKVDGLVLYRDGLTITADKDADGKWEVEKKPHPWGVPVERLAYKPRPGRPFGQSRISRAVMSLHEQALRTVIRMEGHMDIFSLPQLALLGASEGIFTNPDGTQKASWQVALGRVLGIPDDDEAENPRADLKVIQASSPEPHIVALKQQAQLFSGETSIPLTSLGVSDMSNPTSADSYIASREDLIAEAEGATSDFTPPLRRTGARLLAIQNGLDEVPAALGSLDMKFRPPAFVSKSAQADAGMKQIAAVPWLAETEVGLELLGLTPQQIKDAMADRRRASGRAVLNAIRPANGPVEQ